MAPLDSRYNQVSFNLVSVQVCRNKKLIGSNYVLSLRVGKFISIKRLSLKWLLVQKVFGEFCATINDDKTLYATKCKIIEPIVNHKMRIHLTFPAAERAGIRLIFAPFSKDPWESDTYLIWL